MPRWAETRQGAWNGDYTEERFGIPTALTAQKKGDGQGFVQDVRKRMGGVYGDRSEHGIDAALVKRFGCESGFGVEFGNGEDTNGLFREGGKNLVIPAFVLVANEKVHGLGDFGKFLLGGQAIRAHALRALFDFLKEAGDTDFYEFVQIVCGDGEKLDALEKWVARVARFFQNAAIELQPLDVAIEVVTRVFECDSCHKPSQNGRGTKRVAPACYGKMNEAAGDKLRRGEVGS